MTPHETHPRTAQIQKGSAVETIKARVHDATIDKVSQFFDAQPFTVLQEMLQNARRSGATQVFITEPDSSTITIADDGHGIADPQSLLDFGRSEWTSLDHENPAGMGFFALARYQVAITSRPAGEPTQWHAEIGPDHFAGRQEAEVTRTPRDSDTPDGTTVTITLKPGQLCGIERAALYFPLPITWKDRSLQRKAFLGDAVARTVFEGVEIGVFDPMHRTDHAINFYGVTAKSPRARGRSLFAEPACSGSLAMSD